MPLNALRTHTHRWRKITHLAQVLWRAHVASFNPAPTSYDGFWQAGAYHEPYGAAGYAPTNYAPQYVAAAAAPYAPSTVYFPYDSQGAAESTQSRSTSDDPHVLTAQIAQPIQYPSEMKETPRDIPGVSGRDEWVADSGASYHVTGDPTGMFDCEALPVGKERIVIGDMKMMGVECFGKLSLLMHCKGGDTRVRLTNVACVLGVQLNLFSLHAVMSKCLVTMDTKGVHMLGGSVSFVRREAGSYCSAIRITNPPMANAVLVPGKQQRIDINDLHVALAHSHAEPLRETARQHGVEVAGELVPCAGCSEANGRRMHVPRSTNSRPTQPFERLFVDLSGKRPSTSGGHHYLMMIVDDFSRFGWTYFLKEKSDVPAGFTGFLADIRAQGIPSIVECLRSENITGFPKGEFVTLLDHHRLR